MTEAFIYLAFDCHPLKQIIIEPQIVAYITGYVIDEASKVHYSMTLIEDHLRCAYWVAWLAIYHMRLKMIAKSPNHLRYGLMW